MQVKLRVAQGSKAGKELRIPGPVFRIGRGEDCHLRPKSDAISRCHCEIRIEESKVFIVDLGSKNGTFVNDERVEGEQELKMGNLLRAGRLEFEVVIDHSLGGAKRPKIADVKQAAVRTAQGEFDDDDVSGWLDEGDSEDRQRRLSDPDTRQFQLPAQDRKELDETAIAADDTQAVSKGDDETTDDGAADKTKKKLGKLPERADQRAESSRQAASEMLKRFFNRG